MSLVADSDRRKSLMKMLFSTPLISLQTNTALSNLSGGEFNTSLSGFPSPMSESASDDLIPSCSNFIYDISSFPFEDSTSANSIIMEHSYSRAWNWRPETNSIKPARNLLVHKPPACPGCHDESDDIFVDIDGPLSPPPPLPYDVGKGRVSMNEIDTHLIGYVSKNEDCDWEDKIDRTHWSVNENSYYLRVVAILHEDLIARLTVENHRNEPVLRRSIIDRSVLKFRRAFNSVGWDTKMLQWMHNLLMDNLNKTLLSIYLDILQGLNKKVPSLVEKLIFSGIIKGTAISYESLFELLKKPWNPLDDNVINNKIKKIPNSPIIFVCPSCPQVNSILPSRYQQLLTFLNAMATVENVSLNLGFSSSRLTLTQIVEHMLASSRSRLQEIRNENPDRPIVLLGFHSGASLAFQIAQTEAVACIICIGLDFHTAEGIRGTPDDIILNIPYPILFIMGENSVRSHPEEIENLREKMSAETSLIIIGSADDSLRLSHNKKIFEGVTQSMVDRCIMDEIADYVTTILLNPYPTTIKHHPTTYISNHKSLSSKQQFRNKKISKRRFSNGTVCEDNKLESLPKRPRPVGRPKGSLSKNKISSQIHNATPRTLNNSSLCNIPIAMGESSSSSGSNRNKLEESSEVSICNKSLNKSNGSINIAVPSFTRQNNYLRNRNAIKELNKVQQQEVIDKAVLSILPENFEDSLPARKIFSRHDTSSRGDITPDIIERSQMAPFDVSKYKLTTCDTSASSSKLISTSRLSTVPIRSSYNSSKFIKMRVPSSQTYDVNGSIVLNSQNRKALISPTFTGANSMSDKLSETNILDIPIVFADNDGNIKEPLKIENNSMNSSGLISTFNKNPIKLIVLNKSTTPNINNVTLKNDLRTKPFYDYSTFNSSGNYKYPKISLHPSSTQNNVKSNLISNQSTLIDFKTIDLENELVASKVLKARPSTVTTTTISEPVSTANIDSRNKIVLTVGSKISVFKNTFNKNYDKTVIKPPIIIKPNSQIKTIPLIKAQNILNPSFSLKKNTPCTFTGQTLTIQQTVSKDHGQT